MHAASLCSGAGVEVEVPVEEAMNGGGSNAHAYEEDGATMRFDLIFDSVSLPSLASQTVRDG